MLSGFGKCEHSHQPMMPSTNKRLRRAARTRYGWLIHSRCSHVGRAASKGFVVPKVNWGAGHQFLDRHPDNCDGGYSDHDHVKLRCVRCEKEAAGESRPFDRNRDNSWVNRCKSEVKTSFAMVLQKPSISGGNLV